MSATSCTPRIPFPCSVSSYRKIELLSFCLENVKKEPQGVIHIVSTFKGPRSVSVPNIRAEPKFPEKPR